MPREIIIDGPDEYLTSISGWYTNAGITSLTFLTNKKRLTRTIGDEKGTHFSSSETDGKIVGFYGWSDGHLRGIGAYFEPISDLYPAKSIGPFGGGNVWDDGKFDGVKEIYLHVLSNIRYIVFEYDDGSEEGRTIMHGTKRVPQAEKKVDLDYPREYLTSISGYTGNDGSIQSLTFHTNRKIRSFGKSKDGKYFGYQSTGSRVIGFYGTWGETLNSIGVYVKPMPHLYPFEIVRPFEGLRGIEWDDGVYTGLRGFCAREHDINISPTNKIESITFKYDNNGSLVDGTRGSGGDLSSGCCEMLDYPKERLTSVVGYWRVENGQTIIHDLEIRTDAKNRRRAYARRGEPEKEKSNKFLIPEESEKGRIVGFFGTAGEHLNFIGARLEPY